MFRGFQAKDPSCLVLRFKSDDPFPIWRKKGISYTSKVSPVFCGKKPGTRSQPQRPTQSNNWFHSDHIRAAFSSPSDTQQNKQCTAVGHSLMISSLSAAPVSVVLTLLFISVSELLLALCQHSYLCSCVMEGIKEMVHLGVFLGVFTQIKSPNTLADTMQEEHKSMWNHRSWSLAEGQ